MNRNKTISISLIVVILSSLVAANISASDTLNLHRVCGDLFIDDVIAPEDVEVILCFPSGNETDLTSATGHYQIDFLGHDAEKGQFYVYYLGQNLVPIFNESVYIYPDVTAYKIDLYVYLIPDNLPPYPPINPSPENNSIDVSINPTLEVLASDPDGDTMNVSFYNASDDSLIGTDFSVPDGGTASVIWSDLSYDTKYFWYAVAYDSDSEKKSSIWNFKTIKLFVNSPPNMPTNPNPANNTDNLSLNPTLKVVVSDPDGDSMNVSFFDASTDDLIDRVDNVANGTGALVVWYNLSFNITYFWYVVANDSEYDVRSDTWNFKTLKKFPNSPPLEPTDPVPENNSINITLSPTLSVNVTDIDDDIMNISFFDASDDSLIGSDFNVSSGDTASTVWADLGSNTTYYWYAVANDSEFETKSDIWHFTTVLNNPPEKPSDPDPENNATDVDLDPELSVFVVDVDEDIMDVYFYDGSDDSLIGSVSNVENGTTATVTWSSLSYNTTYSWYVVADDSEFETRSDTWQFTTRDNTPPDKPSIPDPVNGQQNVDLNPSISVLAVDPDGDVMDVAFYDASDNSLIGTDQDVPSGTRATVVWEGLDYETVYSWYAIAGDETYSTKSDTWTFETVKNKNPTVSIIKPERGLYFLDRKILPRFIRPTLIIGRITVEAEANDTDGTIAKVEFYLNNKLMKTDDVAPYTFDWRRDRLHLIHTYVLKVVAYDDADATATQKMLVRKFL